MSRRGASVARWSGVLVVTAFELCACTPYYRAGLLPAVGYSVRSSGGGLAGSIEPIELGSPGAPGTMGWAIGPVGRGEGVGGGFVVEAALRLRWYVWRQFESLVECSPLHLRMLGEETGGCSDQGTLINHWHENAAVGVSAEGGATWRCEACDGESLANEVYGAVLAFARFESQAAPMPFIGAEAGVEVAPSGVGVVGRLTAGFLFQVEASTDHEAEDSEASTIDAPDSDGDGIPDRRDRCIHLPGPGDTAGCPSPP